MRLVITGASGNLGRHLVEAACLAGHTVFAWTSPRLGSILGNLQAHYQSVELTHPEEVAEAFWHAQPMAVIHVASLSTLNECYHNPIQAFRINAEATRQLVGLCVAGVSRLIYVSTDLVFDGQAAPYDEDSLAMPLSLYGKSKLDGERMVLHHPGHLVARLSWLICRGTPGRPTFLDQQIAALREGQPVPLFVDEWRTPLGVECAAQALLQLAGADVSGLLHLGGPERLSRHAMGTLLARLLDVSPELVKPVQQSSMKQPEPRPRDVSLDSRRWRERMPNASWLTYEAVLQKMLRGS